MSIPVTQQAVDSGRRRAVAWMIACVALWALLDALAAHLLRPYSPYQVVWSRYAVHLALMLTLWGWRQPGSLLRTRRPVFQLARSLLMLSMPLAFVMGVQHGMPMGTLLAVFWFAPLLVLVLARFILREPVSLSLWGTALLASLGACLLSGAHTLPHAAEIVFPAGMALSFGLYIVMTRVLRSETLRSNLFYTALGVFAALTPVMPHVWVTPGLHDALVLGGIGVLGFLVLLALDRVAASAPVSLSAPAACAQLAFAVVFAWLFGNAHPHLLTFAGLALVGAALFLLWSHAPRGLRQEPA